MGLPLANDYCPSGMVSSKCQASILAFALRSDKSFSKTHSVNTPFITSFTNDSCVDPPFVQTRFGGGSFTDIAVYNETTGLFRYGNYLSEGVNRCINGDCSLPGETPIVDDGCAASVSVFTIDYDAPLGPDQGGVRTALSPLVHFEGGHGMRVKARAGLSSK